MFKFVKTVKFSENGILFNPFNNPGKVGILISIS